MKSFRLWVLFILIIAAAFLSIFFLTGAFVYLGIRLGMITMVEPVPWVPLVGLAFTAAIVSFGFTLMISRYFFTPVHELIKALKQVASGDFQVRLSEDLKWDDIREMNVNFNRMVKELNSIQLLQSDFITNVSHEIKTPLASIEGYISLLASTPLTREQQEYSSRILESSRRITTLTGEILQLSRLENQQIVPERKRFLLDEQLRRCILSMEPLWSEKGLELDIDLAETECLGNEELLAQVWSNLLSNAIKYTPAGGSIAICLTRTNHTILVTFRDSGIGISPEDQKHIFEKFYQADRSRGSGGNGLGLALASRILTLCGGEISVESCPGKGSLFTVLLAEGR